MILSGIELFEYIGWGEVKDLIYKAIEKTILDGYVTYDLF